MKVYKTGSLKSSEFLLSGDAFKNQRLVLTVDNDIFLHNADIRKLRI
jgi:hypothetical protein